MSSIDMNTKTTNPKIIKSITNIPNAPILKRSCTDTYRSISSVGNKATISDIKFDGIDADQSGWSNVPYEETDLHDGDILLNNTSNTLRFGSIGSQSISKVKYNKSYDDEVMPEFKVNIWPTDKVLSNNDTILETFINKGDNDIHYYDFFAVIQIDNATYPIAYNKCVNYYKDKHLASHSGDTTETKLIRVFIINLDGTITVEYVQIRKLRHTIIINIPNLIEIANDKSVAVFLYNAGYNGGCEHMLVNYMPQEIVCDISIIDVDNNKKKYLFESPLYAEDSVKHSAALVAMVSIKSDEAKIHILQKFEQGSASNPDILHRRVITKYKTSLLELDTSLQSVEDHDEMPQFMLPPPMVGIQRSIGGFH